MLLLILERETVQFYYQVLGCKFGHKLSACCSINSYSSAIIPAHDAVNCLARRSLSYLSYLLL